MTVRGPLSVTVEGGGEAGLAGPNVELGCENRGGGRGGLAEKTRGHGQT
jgi:hypothetical protein